MTKANFTTSNGKGGEKVFLNCMDTQNKSKNIWFLDSGCSNHMTRDKDMFVNLNTSINKKQVIFGDGKKSNVE